MTQSKARTKSLQQAAASVAALALLILLSACSSQSTHVSVKPSYYNRPTNTAPPGPPDDPWGPWIRDAASRFEVPELWIREVMRQESGGRAAVVSSAGAIGLMQVMPDTYRGLSRRYDLGPDPYHPYDNIQAGTAYIREMYDLYGSPAFLAAYNAGPRRLDEHLNQGRVLPNETRNYVAKVGPRIAGVEPTRRGGASPSIASLTGPGRTEATQLIAFKASTPSSSNPTPAARIIAAQPLPALGGSSASPVQRLAGVPAATPSATRSPLPSPVRYETASAVPPPAPSRVSFSLFGTAHAATLPREAPRNSSPTHVSRPWAAQVGAYPLQLQAQQALSTSQNLTDKRIAATPAVTAVPGATPALYRARLLVASRRDAEEICSAVRGKTPCMVVPPGS